MEPNERIPESFDRDLHPARYTDERAEVAAGALPTLYEQKAAVRELPGFTDDDLKRIPVLPEGARLEQGSTYLDLADPNAQPFTAMGGMVAGSNNLYIDKHFVSYLLWNRLIGVSNPARLDEAAPQ